MATSTGYPRIVVTKKSLDEMLLEANNKLLGIKAIITPKNRESMAKAVFTIGGNAFIRATNTRAKDNKPAFHHIYEWNQVGTQKGRLFNLVRTSVKDGRLIITSQFYESNTEVPISKELSAKSDKKSVKSVHIFKNKANVMEDGNSVRIEAKTAKALVFASENGLIFIPKPHSVVVRNPGGIAVKGSYTKHFREWFRNPANIYAAVAATAMFKSIEKEVARELNARGAGAARVTSVISSVTARYSKGLTTL